MRTLLVALLVGLGACGAPPPTAAVPEAVEPDFAAKQTWELIREVYSTLRRGNAVGLLGIMDPNPLLVGPAANHVSRDRSSVLVALAEHLGEGKHSVTSRDLRTFAAPSGHAAWAHDQVDLDGKRYSVAWILTETDGLWTVASVHVGLPASGGDNKEAVVVPTWSSGNAVAPLDAAFAASTASHQALLDALGDNPSALVVEPSAKVRGGKKAAAKAWKKQLKAGAPWSVRADRTAGVSPDGELGWVFGVIDRPAETPPQVRVLHVFQRRENAWELVLAHHVVAR